MFREINKKTKLIQSHIKGLFFLFFLLISCNSASDKRLTKKEISSVNEKAFSAYKLGNHQLSIHYYNILIKDDSLNGEYYFNRAYSFSMLLKREEAVKDYLMAAGLNYRNDEAFYNIGLNFTHLNDSIALIYFKKAIEINPGSQDIRNALDKCEKRIIAK